jgi:hypothetical protein
MSDLDSAESVRNEAGVLTRNRIRQGVTKVELAFIVDSARAAVVLALIEPVQVTVECYDPRSLEPHIFKAYVSDRSCVLKVYNPEQPRSEMLWEISFNLVEY